MRSELSKLFVLVDWRNAAAVGPDTERERVLGEGKLARSAGALALLRQWDIRTSFYTA